MKRLNYFDYVKTPESWKSKALDIPNQMQMVKSKRRYKPSAILIACAIVVSLSGVGVYAVESGVMDSLKSYFNNKDVPYSYYGTYNKVDENYIYDNITECPYEIIGDNDDNTSIEVKGYVADDYNAYIVMDIILEDGVEFKQRNDYYTNDYFQGIIYSAPIFYEHYYDDFSDYWKKSFEVFNLSDEDMDSAINFQVENELTQIKFINDDNLEDNIVPIVAHVTYKNVDTMDKTYIYINGITSSNSNNPDFDVEVEMNKLIVLDISANENIVNRIEVNDTYVKDYEGTILKGISYSPLSLYVNFYYDNSKLDNDFIEQNDITPKIYYIYSDGTKVYQSLSQCTSEIFEYEDNNFEWGLNFSFEKPVDFSDIVSIQVNDRIIPLR